MTPQMEQWRACMEMQPRIVGAGRGAYGPGIELHRLTDRWVVLFCSYHAELRSGESKLPVSPGTILLAPPLREYIWNFPTRIQHDYCGFVLPETTMQLPPPLAIQTGASFEEFHQRVTSTFGRFNTSPQRIAARLWDVLWDILELEVGEDIATHPAVLLAVRLIERQMSQPLRVSALAEAVGISHNQLTRLFQKRFGCTVLGYIRKKRIEHAVSQLRHSSRPIKAIAAEVGLGDLRNFSTIIHREMGIAPRDIRSSSLVVINAEQKKSP